MITVKMIDKFKSAHRFYDRAIAKITAKNLAKYGGLAATVIGMNIGAFGNAIYQDVKAPQEKVISVEDNVREKQDKTFYVSKDGSQDWDGETRHWHVTPKGDTIVSYLNQEQADEFEEKMERSVPSDSKDPPEDPQDPRWGLNGYVPANDTNYQTNTDWYGSGDIDGNGEITWEDYFSTVTGTDPFNDGTHRGDVNLDGATESSQFSQDKQIIYEYLMGERNHINVCEFETEPQQINHLEKALAIDPTSEISAGSSGWVCYNYRGQTYINFNGIYNIENSIFAEPNGTNQEYDIEHNGFFRIPLRYVSTVTSPGGAHAINSVYLGNPANQNAKEFDYKIFIEPQTDEFQEIGDYSLNDYAKEKWYGYYYNSLFEEWRYGTRDLINYDISSGNAVIDYTHPQLVIPWNPLLKSEFPEDQTHEFPADTSTATNGIPTSLYHGTQVNYSDESNQTSNGTCGDVSYDVSRGWELVAGAYNSSNTSGANHVQNIGVEDTSPPERDESGNWTDNSSLEVIVTRDTTSTQGSDTTQCNYYSYEINVDETGTDVCGNEGYFNYPTETVENQPPHITSLPVPNYDTIYVFNGQSIHPDSTGWAEWADPEGGPIQKYYSDELKEQSEDHYLWERTQTGEDPCVVSPDSAIHYIYQERPNGIENKVQEDNASVYPNPTMNYFTLNYNKPGNIKVGLYDVQGKLLEEKLYNNLPEGIEIPYDLRDKARGLYVLKIQGEDGSVETEKVVKQ